MKKSVVGILAHVDAGKTTLSESLLYKSGVIRKLGRVDHKDTFLDFDPQERDRGITIFSKQSHITYKDLTMTLLDTPGHTDFSSEMERTLQVLDYAILLISSLDGVTAHTETIFKLLKHYQVPTFVFVNKMDYGTTSEDVIMSDLNEHLKDNFINFSTLDKEELSLVNETLLNEYLDTGSFNNETISKAIVSRSMYPVMFGSALKDVGIDEFLECLYTYIQNKEYVDEKRGLCYKVMYSQKEKISFVKVLGGTYKVKDVIKDEKINQIRIYNGLKYETVNELHAGEIGALVGLNELNIGDHLENDHQNNTLLQPYLHYHMSLPHDGNQVEMISNILTLAKEDPTLNIEVDNNQVYISLMGEIQIEVLTKRIKENFGIDVSFDQGKIQYLETIRSSAEGVGHFEPLRHYAEVHIYIEPGEKGSGIVVEDKSQHLERHYVRSIRRYLYRGVPGVIGGYPITDIKITILGGKSHIKHTEGGDFRQATQRAFRQALTQVESVVLEPYYRFELSIPTANMSKALYDLETFGATFKMDTGEDTTIITGSAPVIQMRNYQKEVINYTKGAGKLLLTYDGYEPVKDLKPLNITYDASSDERFPTGSVFCAHGAGFYVPPEEVFEHMHLPLYSKVSNSNTILHQRTSYNDEDLNKIFERTYGKQQVRLSDDLTYSKHVEKDISIKEFKPECLIVDGYNVIGASDKLKELSQENLDLARNKLLDLLGNYQGYKNNTIIVVFDAYKVKGNLGSEQKVHNLHVVYTKEAQTADAYIERVTKELASKYRVYVATSDLLEQTIILGNGAYRISSRELLIDMDNVSKNKMQEYNENKEISRNFLLEDLSKIEDEL